MGCINGHYNQIGITAELLLRDALKVGLVALKGTGGVDANRVGQLGGSALYLGDIQHMGVIVNLHGIAAAAGTNRQQAQKKKKSQEKLSGTP